ncbi:hypothetical protein BCR43DRAFT_527235 [Syncephalastrum racemosum]|uniref:Uncharacterized protein n=1 Tax=Syncephalastrum racemosum TaxID=13706 RepID=A0A1X2H2G8_SYNRA|nr:hypothetical protein BCR43DRAFT_527235 [Syncephalastrum racemosum]
MEKSLSDYDQSLEELERQREHLEQVMKKMGQEWEESGAGIGWLGSFDLASNGSDTTVSAAATTPASLPHTPDDVVVSPDCLVQQDPLPTPMSPNMPPTPGQPVPHRPMDRLLHHNAITPTGPSPDYIQSLLHVNETLLAQSLSDASPITPSTTSTAISTCGTATSTISSQPTTNIAIDTTTTTTAIPTSIAEPTIISSTSNDATSEPDIAMAAATAAAAVDMAQTKTSASINADDLLAAHQHTVSALTQENPASF